MSDGQHAPLLATSRIRITRTPLGGAADPSIEADTGTQTSRRLISWTLAGAQSTGAAEGRLILRNDDGALDAWATGDALRIEDAAFNAAAYTVGLDGCVGGIQYGLDQDGRPIAIVPVFHWSAILDLVNLPTDLHYENTPWTTIADSILTAALGVGFARTITADALTPTTVTLLRGTKLREALDLPRRALNGGASKWEHVLDIVAGTKTYLLYKRLTTVQRTLSPRHLLPGSAHKKGDIREVINQAVVRGATVPTEIEDRTTGTRAGYLRPAATTLRLAQPFQAKDTPLSLVTLYADRSLAADPPTLTATVARNGSTAELLRRGVAAGLLAFRTHASIHDEAASALDQNDTTTITETVTVGAGATVELFALDLGATPPAIIGAAINKSFGANGKVELSYSDNDAAYTVAWTGATGAVTHEANLFAAAQTHRYWRLRAIDTGAGHTAVVRGLTLLAYKNVGADATDPEKCQDLDAASSATTTASTGAADKEIARFDLGATPPALGRIEVRHSESTASGLLVLAVQSSPDGSAWTDLALLDSTTSIVNDTIPVGGAAARHLRVLVRDTRAAASASITTSLYEINAYAQTATPTRPLVGPDVMKGSSISWDISGLVERPGNLEPRTYPAPRLALIAAASYWLVLSIGSAATSKSWWDLAYACGLDTTGLSLYWSFEEATGLTVHDGSGNGLDGTLTAGGSAPANVPEWIQGAVGGGLYVGYAVNGSHVLAADTAGTNPASALSIALRLRPATLGTKQGILGKGNGNPGAYSLFIDTDGKLLFVFWTGGTRKTAKSTTALTAAAWNKVGVKYDGANVTFYRDGATDGVTAQTGAIDTKADNFRVGHAFDTGVAKSELVGGLDELYFLLRVLGDAEFAFLHSLASTQRALASQDSGATWYALPADTLLLTRLEFNTHQLVGTAQDTASQAAYAALVPGGVLSGGFQDDALQTQDAVDAQAAVLVKRRAMPVRRLTLMIPHDPTLLEGQRVRLDAEAAGLLRLGNAGLDVDVVRISHAPYGEALATTLDCEEYPLEAAGAADATVAYATRRTI